MSKSNTATAGQMPSVTSEREYVRDAQALFAVKQLNGLGVLLFVNNVIK